MSNGSMTEWEALTAESTTELSPAKLNESLDRKLAFVTTNLAVLVALATGFGLIGNLGDRLRSQQTLVSAAFIVLTASLAVALAGNMPNWWGRVNPSDLQSVEDYFMKRYRWRAWAARLSISSFIAAVCIAGLAAVLSLSTSTTPDYSLDYMAGEKPTLKATISTRGLTRGSTIDTTIRGCMRPIEGMGRPGVECPSNSQILAKGRSVVNVVDRDLGLTIVNVPEEMRAFEMVIEFDGEAPVREVLSLG